MRKVPIRAGGIYHLYNRGVNKDPIFFKNKNWDYFLFKFFEYCSPKKANIFAYCLMPNHYHFLVKVNCTDFSTTVMMPFLITYAKAINLQEKRVGPLFQGSYQVKPVNSDEELVYVSRYIHLNPVKAGLVNHPKDWKYSSYMAYLGDKENALVETDAIFGLFSDKARYFEFVERLVSD